MLKNLLLEKTHALFMVKTVSYPSFLGYPPANIFQPWQIGVENADFQCPTVDIMGDSSKKLMFNSPIFHQYKQGHMEFPTWRVSCWDFNEFYPIYRIKLGGFIQGGSCQVMFGLFHPHWLVRFFTPIHQLRDMWDLYMNKLSNLNWGTTLWLSQIISHDGSGSVYVHIC